MPVHTLFPFDDGSLKRPEIRVAHAFTDFTSEKSSRRCTPTYTQQH